MIPGRSAAITKRFSRDDNGDKIDDDQSKVKTAAGQRIAPGATKDCIKPYEKQGTVKPPLGEVGHTRGRLTMVNC